jgi:hypothetical protein
MTTDDNDPIPFDELEPDMVKALPPEIRMLVATIQELTNAFVGHFEYTVNEARKDEERLLEMLTEARNHLGKASASLSVALDAIRILPKYVGTIERAEPKP